MFKRLRQKVLILFIVLLYFGLCNEAFSQTDLSSKNWKKLYEETIKLVDADMLSVAKPYGLRAEETAKQRLGEWHPRYAEILEELGRIHLSLDELDETERCFLRVLAIYKKTYGTASIDYAYALVNLADLYHARGNSPKAIEYLQRSMHIFPEGGLDYHLNQQQVAFIYTDMGLYAEAEKAFREVLSAFRQHPEWDGTYMTSLINDITWLYELMGRYQEARELLEEALETEKRTLGTDSPIYLTTLHNLATLYGTMGLYELAIPLMEEVLDQRDSADQNGGLSHANTMSNLASMYANTDRPEEAIELSTQALNIVMETIGKENQSFITYISILASIYQDKEDYHKADSLLKEAMVLAEQVYGKESIKTAELYDLTAGLYLDMQKYAQAESLMIAALDGYYQSLQTTFPLLSEEEENAFLEGFRDSFELFHTIVLKRLADNPSIAASQYDFILLMKGLLFQTSSLMRKSVSESDDLQLKGLYAQWQQLREEMARVYTLSASEREMQEIDQDSLEAEVNQLEKQLSERVSIFNKSNNMQAISWREIQQKLAPGEAAVEILRHRYYDKQFTDSIIYQALIITKESKNYPLTIVLDNGNALEGRYSNYYASCIKYQIEDRNSYQQFWEKISTGLEGIDKVYLSADGFYHSININGLYNTESGEFLADELAIQRVTSTRNLLRQNKEALISDAALFGYPDYNSDHSDNPVAVLASEELEQITEPLLLAQRFFSGNEISELPGTSKEILSIEELMRQKQIQYATFLGTKATEGAVKAIKSPSLVHIATHGYFLKDIASLSSQEDELIYGISPLELSTKPLLRSGLLFANARKALMQGGDGVLTAYEAIGLDLKDTELVVLSACETGLGELQIGEGVYGLQRALQTAGAKAVLMSLWKVSDHTTQLLMTRFYHNLLIEGQNKEEALIKAQRWLRNKYPHPYYWAGFVMVHG